MKSPAGMGATVILPSASSGRTIAPGGNIEFYGGQRETWQPSFEYGGTTGKFSYYMTGSYLHDTRGIEPPTSGPLASSVTRAPDSNAVTAAATPDTSPPLRPN